MAKNMKRQPSGRDAQRRGLAYDLTEAANVENVRQGVQRRITKGRNINTATKFHPPASAMST